MRLILAMDGDKICGDLVNLYVADKPFPFILFINSNCLVLVNIGAITSNNLLGFALIVEPIGLGVKKPPSDGVRTGIVLPTSSKSSSKSKLDLALEISGCFFCCLESCDGGFSSGLKPPFSSFSSSLDSAFEDDSEDDLPSDFLLVKRF